MPGKKMKTFNYCCQDCGNKICRDSALYGNGRCKSCENKNRIKNGTWNIGDRKGKNNGNYKKGKPKCIDCGQELKYYNTKRCLKCFKYWQRIPENNTNFNKKGKEHFLFGKKRPQHSNIMLGNNNPNWIDGRSFLPYPPNWTNKLKQKIKERDNCICQNCGIIEKISLKLFHKKLTIHHIDYNKFDCKEENLITLCCKCNSEANFNRDYWYAYYKYIINNKIYKEIIK